MSSIKTDEFDVDVPGGKIYLKRWVHESASPDLTLILIQGLLGCVDLCGVAFPGN